MSELRFDPVRQKWTIISQERGGRRDVFLPSGNLSPREKDGKCPFCDKGDGKLPRPIFAIPDKAEPSKNALIVIPNKYPVMGIEGEFKRRLSGMFESASGIGAHEIIIDSPRHGLKLADYTEAELYNLFLAFKVRLEDLNKDIRFRYMAAFKNIGKEAGEKVSHSHAQLIAATVIPESVEKVIINADKYYREKERCLFCDIISEERGCKSRIIAENYEYVSFCPYASEFPFETAIYPKKHEPVFSRISDSSITQLADIVKDVFARMAALLDNPALTLALRLSPMKPFRPDTKGYLEYIENSYHWHIEIKPVITVRSGSAWGAGINVNPLKPEDAAQYLREVSSV